MPREYDVDFASGVVNWVHSIFSAISRVNEGLEIGNSFRIKKLIGFSRESSGDGGRELLRLQLLT